MTRKGRLLYTKIQQQQEQTAKRTPSGFRIFPFELLSTHADTQMEPVTTDNYATIAQHDEAASTAATDRVPDPAPTARAARIAQAVERSKTEYQPQHAYTERGVSSS